MVTNLENALEGATRAFRGETNVTLGNISIFDAAYNRACEDVMFSREAIDASMPYIARQIAYYLEGYAVLGQLFDAYEAVYGAGSLQTSRDKMCENLCGIDHKGNASGKSVLALSRSHFLKDKFIFVNKSNNTNIKVSSNIYVATDLDTDLNIKGGKMKTTPAYMTDNPLSAAQVKALAKYCKEKDTTLFEFLFNEMGFTPYVDRNGSAQIMMQAFDKDYSLTSGDGRNFAYVPKSCYVKGKTVYLAAGSQRLESEQGVTCGYSTAPLYGSLQAVKATEKAEDSSKVNVYCNKKYIGDVAMMFFQGTAAASEWKADSSRDAWKEAWKNF